jgi:hypothetical protein
MTTILKSNAAYAGAASLSNVSVLTKRAVDLYADYASRVAADGGVVLDPAECLAAIQSALDGDYYYRMAAAVSPRWGRKVSGANITKLYNLRGAIDGIMTGSVLLDTSTVSGKQLAEFQGGDVMTLTGLTVLASAAQGLAVLQCEHQSSGITGGMTSFTPVASAWDFQHIGSPKLFVGGAQKFTGSPQYATSSLAAHAMRIEMGSQLVSAFIDGALVKAAAASGGFTAIAGGATATVTFTTGGGVPRMGEWWFLNSVGDMPGVNAMMRATADVGGRY